MKFTTSKTLLAFSLVAVLTAGFSGCGGSSSSSGDASITAAQKTTVLTGYADLADARMQAALSDAEALQTAIAAFTSDPTETTLQAAKDAWLVSRESYGLTEAFRLSEGPIDAEEGWVAEAYGAPEGQMNAWPLDENMIDYTIAAGGNTTSGNIIDTAGMFTPNGGDAVDVTMITAAALGALNENGGDANVASGYHAIEFLLWGQDQDYNSFIDDTVTNGPMTAGERPLEDYTSHANADRRKAYLNAAAELLVADLETVTAAWSKTASADCDTDATGCYRAALLGELTGNDAAKNIEADTAIRTIIIGLGVFVKSELANERIGVAALTPSEEDEHSCFSDNTHRDIATNFEGFVDILKAGSASLYSLTDGTTRDEIEALIDSIDEKIVTIDTTAKTSEHFDYQIKPGADNRQLIVDMKNQMRSLGDKMVDVADSFGIDLNEDNVTDPEETQV